MRKSVRTRSKWGDFYQKLFTRMESVGAYLYTINRQAVNRKPDGALQNAIYYIELEASAKRTARADAKRSRRQKRNLGNVARGAFGSNESRNASKS